MSDRSGWSEDSTASEPPEGLRQTDPEDSEEEPSTQRWPTVSPQHTGVPESQWRQERPEPPESPWHPESPRQPDRPPTAESPRQPDWPPTAESSRQSDRPPTAESSRQSDRPP